MYFRSRYRPYGIAAKTLLHCWNITLNSFAIEWGSAYTPFQRNSLMLANPIRGREIFENFRT
jgi:hypothetical protein